MLGKGHTDESTAQNEPAATEDSPATTETPPTDVFGLEEDEDSEELDEQRAAASLEALRLRCTAQGLEAAIEEEQSLDETRTKVLRVKYPAGRKTVDVLFRPTQ